MAAEAVKNSSGFTVVVNDDEILSAQKQLSTEAGILVEPAAAATLAGIIKFQQENQISSDKKILLLMTGNGLKDSSSIQKWTKRPAALSPQDWADYYNVRARSGEPQETKV